MTRRTATIVVMLLAVLAGIPLAAAHLTTERSAEYMRAGTIRDVDWIGVLVSSLVGAHFHDVGITLDIDADGEKNTFRFVVHHSLGATPERLERIKAELEQHKKDTQAWISTYTDLRPHAQTWKEVRLVGS